MVAVGVVAALGLLLPWARTGDRSRSSIDLLASATALDVVSGWQRLAMFIGWFGVVVAAAAALLLVAWDRPRLAAGATVFVGVALVLAFVALAASPFGLAWGAWFSSGLGLVASIGGGQAVVTHVSAREGQAE